MKTGKVRGLLLLLLAVCVVTALFNERFLLAGNVENLIRRSSLFGVLSLGAAFVIISGGIDLSIGSVVCLIGCLVPWAVVSLGLPLWLVVPLALMLSGLIGLLHGALVTGLRLPPFIVTLCGLLLYRGMARAITSDQTQGFGLQFESFRLLTRGRIPVFFLPDFHIPVPFVLLVLLGAGAAFFLHSTVWGRHIMALGRNEQAARYSGVATVKLTILAYVVCALFSGLGGLLFVLDVNSAQPSDFGNFYELYAIAAAVLGGCSLAGGEGSIVGVLLGAALMQVLRNSILLLDIPTQLEYAVIGAVILIGVALDAISRRSEKSSH